MNCDYCLQDVDKKWIHNVEDVTFIGGCELPTISYNFCNNCWAKFTDKVNPGRENEYCKDYEWAIDDFFKKTLYPYEAQPLTSKTVPCPRCSLKASLITYKYDPYFCTHCLRLFESK